MDEISVDGFDNAYNTCQSSENELCTQRHIVRHHFVIVRHTSVYAEDHHGANRSGDRIGSGHTVGENCGLFNGVYHCQHAQ